MTFQIKRSVLAVSVAAAIIAPITGFATNGMNMEGWGPIATGMGGASMAYDNGVAAVMNNPATLGLMEDGASRLDVALGNLGPDINSTSLHPTQGGSADSAATSFFMPAAGYAVRTGSLTYGVGMFAQGGMGTEYASGSAMDQSAGGTGDVGRSEVGVGRLAVPIVYNLDKNITIGGSVDYVFGGMDLKMAMAGGMFSTFVAEFGGNQAAGSASGTLVTGLVDAFVGTGDAATPTTWNGPIQNVNWVNFDFSDDSDYTGAAKGTGITGKIGMTFKVNNNLTIGATYHAKTAMGDLETGKATVSMNVDANFFQLGNTLAPDSVITDTVPVTGTISVNDFQFPAQIGLGMAYKQDKWMVAADVKVIQWADVMDSFSMTFNSDAVMSNGAFGGKELNVEMKQNWEDQTVMQVGGSYQLTSDTALRAGYNVSTNPVPDAYLNPLFPATIESHITLGVGHALSKMSGIDFSLTIAPEVSATNPGATASTDDDVVVTHAQTSWQLMYSQKF